MRQRRIGLLHPGPIRGPEDVRVPSHVRVFIDRGSLRKSARQCRHGLQGIPQSYSIAVLAIFFYDHLLALSDEVRQGCDSRVMQFPNNTALYPRSNTPGLAVERSRGVRTPSVHHSKCISFHLHLATIFWLLFVVNLPCLF